MGSKFKWIKMVGQSLSLLYIFSKSDVGDYVVKRGIDCVLVWFL